MSLANSLSLATPATPGTSATRSATLSGSNDLLKSVIGQLGARVSHIVVNELNDEVFYARINIDLDGFQRELLKRLDQAVEVAPLPRRGRPPKSKTGRLD